LFFSSRFFFPSPIFFSLSPLSPVQIYQFTIEFGVFDQERLDNMYSVGPYILSQALSYFPAHLFFSMLFNIIVYFIVGLRTDDSTPSLSSPRVVFAAVLSVCVLLLLLSFLSWSYSFIHSFFFFSCQVPTSFLLSFAFCTITTSPSPSRASVSPSRAPSLSPRWWPTRSPPSSPCRPDTSFIPIASVLLLLLASFLFLSLLIFFSLFFSLLPLVSPVSLVSLSGAYLKWIQPLSFPYYAYRMLVSIELTDHTFACPLSDPAHPQCQPYNGNFVLQSQNIPRNVRLPLFSPSSPLPPLLFFSPPPLLRLCALLSFFFLLSSLIC
jgi:hypothetical protein